MVGAASRRAAAAAPRLVLPPFPPPLLTPAVLEERAPPEDELVLAGGVGGAPLAPVEAHPHPARHHAQVPLGLVGGVVGVGAAAEQVDRLALAVQRGGDADVGGQQEEQRAAHHQRDAHAHGHQPVSARQQVAAHVGHRRERKHDEEEGHAGGVEHAGHLALAAPHEEEGGEVEHDGEGQRAAQPEAQRLEARVHVLRPLDGQRVAGVARAQDVLGLGRGVCVLDHVERLEAEGRAKGGGEGRKRGLRWWAAGGRAQERRGEQEARQGRVSPRWAGPARQRRLTPRCSAGWWAGRWRCWCR